MAFIRLFGYLCAYLGEYFRYFETLRCGIVTLLKLKKETYHSLASVGVFCFLWILFKKSRENKTTRVVTEIVQFRAENIEQLRVFVKKLTDLTLGR